MRTSTRYRAVVLLSLLASFASCERFQPEPGGERAEPPLVPLVAELRIGSIDGPDALSRVSGILPLEDGGGWVIQPEEQGAKVFDTDGALIRRVGRAGQGPGEFTAPGPIGWWRAATDTIWVGDFIHQRVSLFTRDGDFVRSFPAPQFRHQDEYLVQNPESFFGDGTAIAMPPYRREAVTPGFPLLRYDSENAIVLNEVTRVDRTNLVTLKWGSHGGSGAHPIPDAPIVQYGRDRVMVLERAAPTGPDAGEISITLFDPTGAVLWTRRYPYQPRPLPAAEADSLIGERIPGFQRFVRLESPAVSAEEAEQIYREQVRAPAYRPPVRSALLADDGRTWIEWAAPAGEPVRWWVLDGEGEPQLSFTAPGVLDARGVVGDYLWAVETDELDVPFLVRYRLAGGEARK